MNEKFERILRLERAARCSWAALTFARPIDADDRGYLSAKKRFYDALDSLTPDEMLEYRDYRKAATS